MIQFKHRFQLIIFVKNRQEDLFKGLKELYEFEVNEDVPRGYIIGTINNQSKSDFKFAFKETVHNEYFDIEKSTGRITTKVEMDYEKINNIYLTIIASNIKNSRAVRIIIVHVIIVDVNDNYPTFMENTTWLVVRENSQMGIYIGRIKAVDLDSGIYGEVRYSLGEDAPDAVIIDKHSGIITLAGNFDREEKNFYRFGVRATDGGGLSSMIKVYLFIADENDNPPVLEMEYNLSVKEDVPVGNIIQIIKVSDLDTDNDFNFHISMQGNERNQFGIHNDGKLFVKSPLDREQCARHLLHVFVADQKPPNLVRTASVIVTIDVLDVNDNLPVFISPQPMLVEEEAPIGSIVGTINATDADKDDTPHIHYRIVPNSHPEGIFIIDPLLGQIQVNGRIDYEMKKEYSLLVEVYDGDNHIPSLTNLTIKVLDKDDVEPEMYNIYNASVAENAIIGEVVTRINLKNAEKVGSSTRLFEIDDGDPLHYFAISPRTGIITVNRELDAELVSAFNLTVSIRSFFDSKKRSTIVKINVINVNDKTPTFIDGDHMTILVSENISGPYPIKLGAATAIDDDPGFNGTISYAIIHGNTTLFSIEPNNGEIFVHEILDREVQDIHQVIIRATDLGIPRLSSTILVSVIVQDINDNDPQFELPYYKTSILENSPINVSIIQVRATDRDANENGQIKYMILNEEKIPFRIDAFSGNIYSTESLDREKVSTWQVEVIAADNGKFVQRSSIVIVTIEILDENDNPPLIHNDVFDLYISENAKTGDIIHAIMASDADSNDILEYHLTGMDSESFRIDKYGFIQVVENLIKKSYLLSFKITDAVGNNATIDLNFYTTTAAKFPQFKNLSVLSYEVKEGEEKLIATLKAFSLNTSSSGIIYEIVGGDSAKDFILNRQTGELFSTKKTDYERKSAYVLLIAAIDQHFHPYISYLKLRINISDINDNAPVFDKILYECEIGENVDPDTKFCKISATDKDASTNGLLKYSIDEKEAKKYFWINEQSGEIFTRISLDADLKAVHRFTVSAVDQGSPQLSQTAIVNVHILDENDNSPKFSRLFNAEITENSPRGTFVTQVTSVDADVFSNISYALEGDDSMSFAINPKSGIVKTVTEIDREFKSEYSLKVRATDGIWQVLRSLTVKVLDLNDNAPLFSNSQYVFNVPILTIIGEDIGQIKATDADSGLNGKIRYTLRCPNDYFVINALNGTIRLLKEFHFDANTTFRCEAKAIDHGIPQFESKVNLWIILTEVDDGRRSCPSVISVTFPLPINSQSGDIIANLMHLGFDQKTKFAVDDPRFAIKEYSLIAVSNKFDTKKISLLISATSRENPMIFCNFTATLELTEDNMNSPKFTKEKYIFNVTENSPLFSEIGSVLARDDDKGINGRISYHIRNITSFPFNIHSNNGSIYVNGPIDYEEDHEFKLLIEAIDGGFINKNSSVEVSILVSENAAIGTEIGRVTATDIDSHPYNSTVYIIISEKDNSLPFSINENSGIISVTSQLDYEFISYYHFHIAVKIFNLTGSNVSVDIFVESVNEFEPKFLRKVETFKVSSKAFKGTIVGKVTALDFDDGRHGRIFYAIIANKFIEMDDYFSEILVKRNLLGDLLEEVELEIAAFGGKINRFSNIQPDICQILIKFTETPPIPLMEPNYLLQMSEDAQPGTRIDFLSFSLPHGSKAEIVESERQTDQVYCMNVDSSLRLCGPIDRERLAKHFLTVHLLEGDVVRSRTKITILIQDVNDCAPTINPSSAVGFIRENSPSHFPIMKLNPVDNDFPLTQKLFTYKIKSDEMNKIFSIGEYSGILSSLRTFDREKRSLYQIPIEITDKGRPPRSSLQYVRVHIDDVEDNTPSMQPRNIIIESSENSLLGNVATTLPVNADEVTKYTCKAINASFSDFVLSSDCKLFLSNPISSSSELFVKIFDSNSTDITIRCNIQLNVVDSFYYNKAVLMDIFGTKSSIANFINSFQSMVPDMHIRLIGIESRPTDSFRLFMLIVDRNGRVVNAEESIRMIANFVSKMEVSLDNIVGSVFSNICSIENECMHGGQCEQYTLINDRYEELIGHGTTRIARSLALQYKCICKPNRSGSYCEHKNSHCTDDRKCINGGKCDPDSDKCLCKVGYTGQRCELDVDECLLRKDICGGGKCVNIPGSFKCVCQDKITDTPCENRALSTNLCAFVNCLNGKCISDDGKARCECEIGFEGEQCQFRVRSFRLQSYVEVLLPKKIFDIKIEFKTTLPSALLYYSYTTASLNDFAVIDIINGKIRYSSNVDGVGFSNFAIHEKINDGTWKRIHIEQKWQTLKITLQRCEIDGYCKICDGKNCSAVIVTQLPQLSITNGINIIGSITNTSEIAKRPAQISAIDFIGCMRRIEFNGKDISSLDILTEQSTGNNCSVTRSCQDEHFEMKRCGDGLCKYSDFSDTCICEGGYDAFSCSSAMQPWLLDGGEVHFELSVYMLRQISFISVDLPKALEASDGYRSKRSSLKDIPCEETEYNEGEPFDGVTQWMEIDFRTFHANGIIFTLVENGNYSRIELINGSLHFITIIRGANPIDIQLDGNKSDGKWYRVGLQQSKDQRIVRFNCGDHGKEIYAEAEFPRLISNNVNSIKLGNANDGTSFVGCVRRFIVNNQAQLFDKSEALLQQIFVPVESRRLAKGCTISSEHLPSSLHWNSFWTLFLILTFLIVIALPVSLFAFLRHLRKWNTRKEDNRTVFSRTELFLRPTNLKTNAINNPSMRETSSVSSFSAAMRDLQRLCVKRDRPNSSSSTIYASGENLHVPNQHSTPKVTLHSINRQMEKQESNLRQLKHAIRQSRISIHNSALNPSSSECSYDEPIRCRQRHRSNGPQKTDHYRSSPNSEMEYFPLSVENPLSLTPAKQVKHGYSSQSTILEGQYRSDKESDSIKTLRVSRNMVPRMPRSTILDSDSSTDQSIKENRRISTICVPSAYV